MYMLRDYKLFTIQYHWMREVYRTDNVGESERTGRYERQDATWAVLAKAQTLAYAAFHEHTRFCKDTVIDGCTESRVDHLVWEIGHEERSWPNISRTPTSRSRTRVAR